MAGVDSQHIQMPVQARDEIRAFEQIELLPCLFILAESLLLSLGKVVEFLNRELGPFHAKFLEGPARPAGKNENAFADGMGDFSLLKRAILHWGEQILQPPVILRI